MWPGVASESPLSLFRCFVGWPIPEMSEEEVLEARIAAAVEKALADAAKKDTAPGTGTYRIGAICVAVACLPISALIYASPLLRVS